jgi:hypothetical protein
MDKPSGVHVVVSCEFTWQVVHHVPLTFVFASSRSTRLDGRVPSEVDDLGPEGNQNKLGPLEDLLEVATPMGLVVQHSSLVRN